MNDNVELKEQFLNVYNLEIIKIQFEGSIFFILLTHYSVVYYNHKQQQRQKLLRADIPVYMHVVGRQRGVVSGKKSGNAGWGDEARGGKSQDGNAEVREKIKSERMRGEGKRKRGEKRRREGGGRIRKKKNGGREEGVGKVVRRV